MFMARLESFDEPHFDQLDEELLTLTPPKPEPKKKQPKKDPVPPSASFNKPTNLPRYILKRNKINYVCKTSLLENRRKLG